MTSRITTSWPRSAKQAPVTRPTYPAPNMPIVATGARLLGDGLQPAGDREHRLVRQLVPQGVHDPVARSVRPVDDHVDVPARRVDVEAAPGLLVEVLAGRPAQDRCLRPVRLDHVPVVRAVREGE